MSFKAMEWAFEPRPIRATSLLVLVFLAKCLNDKTGQCTPSVQTIATATHQCGNTVRRALKELEAEGLISRRMTHDPSNRILLGCEYFLNLQKRGDLGGSRDEVPPSFREGGGGSRDEVPPFTKCSTPLQEMKHPPSRDEPKKGIEKGIEKGKEKNVVKKTRKKCAIDPQKVLDLYRQILPELPDVRGLTDSRKTAIEARAKDAMQIDGVKADELEGWFSDFFERVRRSSFLMGKKTDFIARFDWLLKKANAQKVLDGNYEDRRSGGGKGLPPTSEINYYEGLYD